MEATETKYLTVEEFAQRAGVHKNTVYKAIAEDRISHRKIRKGFERHEYRIPETELPADAAT